MIALNRRRYMGGGIKLPPNYLTLIALESGTMTFTYGSDFGTSNGTKMSYSVDGGNTWSTLNNADGSEVSITTPTLQEGDRVLWKGTNVRSATANNNDARRMFFSSTCQFDAEGDTGSLFIESNFEGHVFTQQYMLCKLFKGTSIVHSDKLVLLTSSGYNAYDNMFNGCTSLVNTPDLSNAIVTANTFSNCFNGCGNLETTPDILPATTLAIGCYNGMFQSCSKITKAPVLPATTLVTSCYGSMFRSCSSLNYIKAMFTTTPSNTYTYNWVQGVASSGTFVKNSNATWSVSGMHGIPNNWTVETASS